MSRTLKTVGTIAGALALAATGVGAVAGTGLVLAGGVTVGAVATAAGITATAATAAAQLTTKAPAQRGNVTQLIIAPDHPQPYLMGEGYYTGVLRHDAAYGATLNDVPNPYRGMAVLYSGGGPVQSITPYVDKAAIDSYYSTYLYTDTQLGDTPEAAALAPNFAGLPGWDSSSKLSGQAAILWNLKFDKKGKRFASGVPQIGAYGQWTKAYDPRLDDTFPGGAGGHRVDDETTWEWTENPALHFGTYAYGRHQNAVRTIGCGLTSIDWGVIAAWANVCEANSWTIFGVVYEPGNRWDNLKDIATAGGAVPVVSSGGLLSVKYWAPQVALDTITAADIAQGQVQYSPLQSWDERINTIVPRFTSAANEWNQVAAEPVGIAGFVTEDGEEKRKEWPYNLVKDAGQAAQLAAYQIYEGREINPIVIPCLPRLRTYRPGECLTLDLPDYGLEMDAIILQRALDPATMTVTLTLIGETPAKHAVALGQSPAPPAAPVAGQDGADRDETSYDVGSNPPREVADEAALLALSVPEGTVVKRTDNGQVYFYNGGTSGTMADWTLLSITSTSSSLYEAGPPTPPTTASLATWDNQGTSTVADGTGAMILKPQVDNVLHGRYTTAPATPYDVYCRVDVQWFSTAADTAAVAMAAGILFKDTGGDNERLLFGIFAQRVGGDENMNWAALIQRWSGASPPVVSANVLKYGHAPWLWYRVNNDGTTLTFYASPDGRNWLQIGTEPLATYIDGAASFGVGALAAANATEAAALFSYFSTTAPA